MLFRGLGGDLKKNIQKGVKIETFGVDFGGLEGSKTWCKQGVGGNHQKALNHDVSAASKYAINLVQTAYSWDHLRKSFKRFLNHDVCVINHRAFLIQHHDVCDFSLNLLQDVHVNVLNVFIFQ